MTLRTFLGSDGTRWSVWRVESASPVTQPGAPREWLAFTDERGAERRRLFEIPANWEALPDARLDLLRLVAERAPSYGSMLLPEGVENQPASPPPNAASNSRTFPDREGNLWHVWEVRPTLAERRRMRERRAVTRVDDDRRHAALPRPLAAVHETLREGWLAFRSATEHRRRAPIPEGWTEMSDEELIRLLDSAIRFERTLRTG